jgi:4-aminobutyrate aminotransferase/(S)-3-amino-2-methylpropionate transaminase
VPVPDVDVRLDRVTKRYALTPRADLAKALLAAAMARNVLLLSCGTHGQVVRIIPPLVTTDDEADLAVAVIGDSLASIGA